MRTPSAFQFTAFLLVLTALPVACSSPDDAAATPAPVEPMFVITPGATSTGSASAAPFNFGQVAALTTKTQIFTLTNTGTDSGTIPDVSAQVFQLSDPFSLAVSAAQAGIQPCAPGSVLPAKGGSCLFSVQFSPNAEGSFSNNIQISYAQTVAASGSTPAASPAPAPKAKVAAIQILGQGILDCSVAGPLTDARVQGVQAAQDKMAADAVRGTADGKALTYDQGHADGYSDGYNSGYTQGYNSDAGYNGGYNVGYNDGLSRGLTDPATCTNGTNDAASAGYNNGSNDGGHAGYTDGYNNGYAGANGSGYNAGYSDGIYIGKSDGSNSGANDGAAAGRSDGYNAGYSQGSSDGYAPGYSDGADSCTTTDGSSGTGFFKPTSDVSPNLVNGCFNQGYNATYSTSAYWNAYNAAKAANPQYQSGYSAGSSAGYGDGQNAGVAQGYTDGVNAGESAGFQVGANSLYTNCYNGTYPNAYSTAYNNAYNSAYDSGIVQGSNDAYTDSYNQGRSNGYNDGYGATYNPAYDDNYSAAYSDSYNGGYNDGYNAGYSDGYSAGEYDTCGGNSANAIASSKARISRALAKRTIVVPKHSVPAQSATVKPRNLQKRSFPLSTAPKPSKLFGTGQAWWKMVNNHGVSTYVASKLPKSVEAGFSPEELKAFFGIGDLSSKGSLRGFLKTQSEARRIQGGKFGKTATPVIK